MRTGWFAAETSLTPAAVTAGFGLLQTVALDGRVDAEPLVIFGQPIAGQGTHDVVYVATEHDSLYAIDAESGAILWTHSFGASVPTGYKDDDDNVYPEVGVLSTPVIDRSANTIYVVADTYDGSSDAFSLHAIALDSGQDALAPVQIQAAEQLKNGKTWVFNPQHQLQRPGLLEAGGNIYVAFGSTGDIVPQLSRGLILAFNATTLAQRNGLLTNAAVERRSQPPPFYLSSVWQSGYGPAADENGNVLLSTGNSDWKKPSYDAHYNLPDSVLEFSGDL
jgi:PQQ enzyme repeat